MGRGRTLPERRSEGGALSRTLLHVRNVVDQSDQAFVFLGRGIGRFGSLATQGIEELTSLGTRRLGPGEAERPSPGDGAPSPSESTSELEDEAFERPFASPSRTRRGAAITPMTAGDRESLRADIESALASLATEEPLAEARTGLEVLPFIPHDPDAPPEGPNCGRPSPLLVEGPGTAPLIRALATVVAEHDGDDPNSLHEDERLWLLVELLHSLTPEHHDIPPDHDDRESTEEDAPCTDCG